MKGKNLMFKYIFSFAGLIFLFCAIVALNSIIGKIPVRIDITEDKLYSLSDGTKKALGKLDTPITLRFYRSRKDNRMPVQLRSFSERIKDLLDEYVINGKGKLALQEFDPTPDSDSEDSANMDNVRGQMMPDGENFYLGLAVNCLDKTVSIPFIAPQDETKIEYMITSAIFEAGAGDAKKRIGIITDLPVMGEDVLAFMRQGQPKPPWIFVAELQKRFDVKKINISESIPDGIKVLILLHPKNLSDEKLYNIDQYLMNGGKLIIALDPYCFSESRTSPQAMMGQTIPPGSSNMEKFLKNWNIKFSDAKVLVDTENSMRNINSPEMEVYPTVLDFRDFAKKSNDPAISDLDHVNMIYAGAFSAPSSPSEGLKLEKIVSASPSSGFVEAFMAELPGAQILKDFKKDASEKNLILKLSGKFKTAFPGGMPSGTKKKEEKEGGKIEKTDAFIKESPDTFVLLLSDVDMFADEFCVARQQYLGRLIVQPFNDNLIFFQNIVEQMSGDSDLIGIRTRRIRQRPLSKIMKIQAEAQDKYQKEIFDLEKKRGEAQQRINELQHGKDGKQKYILSSQQVEEIKKYRTESAETAKKLKQTRKDLRKEIDSLQTMIQVVNSSLIPALVILAGLGMWLKYHTGKRSK
jgi:ABC-type uncharacterized transport system involved in gliding motility auxiliary subunit